MLHGRGILSILVPLAVLYGGPLTLCFAQGEAAPRWTDSTTTKVVPERKREFEAHLRELIAAHKRAGTSWFQTFETFAGDTTEYTTLMPVMMFGDLDGPSPVAKAFGERGWELLSRKFARCYTARNSQYVTPHRELEIHDASEAAPVYWVQTRSLVAQGRLGAYLGWLRDDYCPVLKKAGVARFRVLQPVFGAPSGEIITMRSLKNLAEIDSGPVLNRVLSDEQAREITSKASALLNSSNTTLIRWRGDLSY